MSSGSLQRYVASCYRISKQHFGEIIDKVCDSIPIKLTDSIPELNKENFLEISNKFNAIWNFPNTLGAIDGKHCTIKCPKKSGTLFYNYKV